MKKRIIFILLVLILLIAAGVIYLNSIFLPTKIKSLIINGLQETTGKQVSLGSLRFSIFKGLVLKELKVYDGRRTILSLKEGSCVFLIQPIFKKRIIIPLLRLKSPEIFLERRKDNTLNLLDFLLKKIGQKQKLKFDIFVYKIRVTQAKVDFQDDTIVPPFIKSMENLDLSLWLSLPDSLKFNFQSEIPASPVINIKAQGEFRIQEQQLRAKVSIQNLAAREFSAYYRDLGVDISDGLTNAFLDLAFENDTLSVLLQAENKNLSILKSGISGFLNSDIEASIQYGFNNKRLTKFSGKAEVYDARVSGLEFVGSISNIKGQLTFDNTGLRTDRLEANIWGIPLQAKADLSDFNNPLINIHAVSSLDLASSLPILKEKFKFSFPAEVKGAAQLSVDIQSRLLEEGSLTVKGYLDILSAELKPEKIKSPIEDIKGRIEFLQNQIRWSDLNFKYLDRSYSTKGVLTNFQAPGVQLELNSKDLYLQSVFAINNKLIRLSEFKGKYLNSEISFTGDIDTTDFSNLETNINGWLIIDLDDIKEPLKKFQKQLKQIRPQGIMNAQFNLNGNINNIKSCNINAKVSGSAISAYGLKADELTLDYNQAGGLIDLPLIHLAMYDGAVEANAKINLNSENLPYWLSASMRGIKIEKLKFDTEAKDKDISGAIQADLKINGSWNDLSKLNGAGTIFITEGKLWQLNLFKGLGAFLFDRDFSSIVLNEASCSFSIQDKYISSNNLKMKSNIAELEGVAKIGFDSSVDAALNVKILDEMVPLKGTFRDVTTAIVGQAGRFGVIKISGTLKEPKYKFQTAVVDIIKGLKDVIFGQ